MSLKIETCTQAERIAPVLRLLRSGVPEPLFAARLAQALEEGYCTLIASGKDGDLGCLGYRYSRDVFWGKTLYVDDLVVDPAARGTGIGAALLKVAKQTAAVQGCDHIRLCSGLDRHDAHRFYEQNGFVRSSVQFAYSLTDGEP